MWMQETLHAWDQEHFSPSLLWVIWQLLWPSWEARGRNVNKKRKRDNWGIDSRLRERTWKKERKIGFRPNCWLERPISLSDNVYKTGEIRRAAALKSTARDTLTQLAFKPSDLLQCSVDHGSSVEISLHYFYINCHGDPICFVLPRPHLPQPPPPPLCHLFLLSLSLECRAALKQASGLHQVLLTTSRISWNAWCITPLFWRTQRQNKCLLRISKQSVLLL